jgi:hypothetical protein
MIISPASILECSMAIVGILGALAGLIHGSKCSKIKCGITGCECDRIVEDDKEEDNKKDEFSKVVKNHEMTRIKESKTQKDS